MDGKIKAWLYDNLGARVDFDAPGHWCTTMAYSDDNKRLIYWVFTAILMVLPSICFYGEIETSLFSWNTLLGFFHVALVKMESHSLLNGMRLKVL